ncbi:MAG: PQQ-dependent sugar dehydrogenase [Kofleriaceae bacterium]
MRSTPWLATLSCAALACGGGKSSIDAAGTVDDAAADGPATDGPAIDALAANCTPQAGTTLALEPVADGLDVPVGLTGPDGDPRVFVVQQSGAIRLIKDGALVTAPYLNLGGGAGPVLAGGERGLLGLAFHPQFRTNGKLYVDFTRKPDGATVIAEFTVDPAADAIDASSRRDVLVIPQPFANHNAGWLEFGLDGKLYIAMGDGGSGGDPDGRAQDDTELLGKLLRIDVDARTGSKGYGIPADNPHAGSADGPGDPRPEIWHKGLRNPFRFSFDRGTGDIYLGDVGQGAWEEIDWSPNVPSVNWGWRDREGAHCFQPMNGCATAGRTDPVSEHSAGDGWHSVIGGQVYRGACFPDLVGTYFYSDYYTNEIWSLRISGGAAVDDQLRLTADGGVTHIHADATGELYLVSHDGRVRRIVAR